MTEDPDDTRAVVAPGIRLRDGAPGTTLHRHCRYAGAAASVVMIGGGYHSGGV